MRAIKKDTGLWAYLSKLEGFEGFSDAEIKEHKKIYWREFDRLLKAEKRTKQKREVCVVFPLDEIHKIKATAKAQGYTNVQSYIRECVRADMSKLTVIPHLSIVNEIRLELQQCRNHLLAIKEKEQKNWLGLGSKNLENAERTLLDTDARIAAFLKQPKNLKETILEAIARNMDTLALLRSILAEYGYKINDPLQAQDRR